MRGVTVHEVLLTAILYFGVVSFTTPRRPWGEVLSTASIVLMAIFGSALATLLVALAGWLALTSGIGAGDLVAAWTSASLTAAAVAALARAMRNACPPIRLALVGSVDAAAELAARIGAEHPVRYDLVGYIAAADVVDPSDTPETVRRLGAMSQLQTIIAADRVELLVLAPGVNRLRYFEELTSKCLATGVRATDLDQFYERTFGDVPVTDINSCWFQHLVALDRPPERRLLRRGIDLVLVVIAGIAFVPVLVVLVLLIRRDGGPVLFRQVRIGEGGRPFVMLKLRSMHVQHAEEARWTAEQDPRVTPIGRVIRVSHLDELPQLLNVLRGEMSIVGPRPEQPVLVDRLEALIPYYQRRHLVKPGVAGWAQARCGYAGSEDGSLRKVCHDLYYLRHRSIRFDVAILTETLCAVLRQEPLAQVPSPRVLSRFAREHKRLERDRRRTCVRGTTAGVERGPDAAVAGTGAGYSDRGIITS